MSETPNNKKGGSVFGYLAIMFAVAFFMLLLAYFIQQRNNEVAMSGLRDSITSFESIDELLDENQALREDKEALENTVGELETQQKVLENKLAQTEADLTEERDRANNNYMVMAAVWSVDSLFWDKDYAACAKELSYMLSAEFPYTIPKISYTSVSGSHHDINARLEEISNELIASGYLTKTSDGSLIVPES